MDKSPRKCWKCGGTGRVLRLFKGPGLNCISVACPKCDWEQYEKDFYEQNGSMWRFLHPDEIPEEVQYDL